MAEVALGDQFVALFGAEMRNVYQGCGVVRQNPKQLAGRKPLQAFARLQDRERAEKARCVEFGIPAGHS